MADDRIERAWLRGQVLFESGRHRDAVAAFQELCVLEPDAPRAHVMLAVSLHALNEGEDALVAIRAALALDAELDWSHRVHAYVLASLHRHDEEVDAGREAVRCAPDEPLAHATLLYALLNAHRVDEATLALPALMRLAPEHLVTWSVTGRLRLLIGDAQGAVEALQRALTIDPTDATALRMLAMARRGTQAIEAATDALGQDPTNRDAMFVYASKLAAHGREEEALEVAHSAYELRPDLHGHRALVLQLVDAKKLDEAREVGERAVAAFPTAPDAYAARALAAGERGDLDTVRAALDTGLRYGLSRMFFRIARRWLDVDAALAITERGLAVDRPRWLAKHANTLAVAGRYRDAIVHASEATEGDASAWETFAEIAGATRNTLAAARVPSALPAVSPRMIVMLRAHVALARDEIPSAEAHFREAMEHGAYCCALFGIGFCQLAAGDAHAAVRAHAEAMKEEAYCCGLMRVWLERRFKALAIDF